MRSTDDPRAAYTGVGPDGTLVLLDLPAEDLRACMRAVLAELKLDGKVHEEVAQVLMAHARSGPDVLEHQVAVVHDVLEHATSPIQVVVRLDPPMALFDWERHPTHFLWILLSNATTHPHVDTVAEFAVLMHDERSRERLLAADSAESLDQAYEQALEEELHHAHIPEALRPTGKLFGALRADVARRLPHYVSDFTDALNTKSFAAIVFLYFACLAPSVAFGGLLSLMTEGEIGVVETMIATAITGVVYGLCSGQPLSLLGSTGPVAIFIGMLYGVCQSLGIPYLPSMAWVGMWTAFYLLLIVAFDACSWIRFFTRFTDDVFAALISLIFIWQAVHSTAAAVTHPDASDATALLTLLLALGTYVVATRLADVRRSIYLRTWVREFLADFAPAIAIMVMAAAAMSFATVSVDTLAVPDQFGTTSGRPWLVDPFEAPQWVWFGAALPAVLGALLVYLDQNITVRLVNNPENKLQKGAGYHLDLLVVAALTAVFSLFGLPWAVSATVRSLSHVRSLATVESDGHADHVTGVIENRLTGISVHVLIGMSLLALPLLQQVPMSVLFGLFLYMGVGSMAGNQFFERIRLGLLDPTHYPPTHYLRAVPTRVIASFTAIQAVCLGVLWVVKESPWGIVFPLFIAMLVPVRMGMERLYKREHLALLDAEERPEEHFYDT